MGSHLNDGTQDWLRDVDTQRWVKKAEVDSGLRIGTTTSEAQRIKELEREVKELRRANDIMKTDSAFFAQAEFDRRSKSCKKYIVLHHDYWVEPMCRLLQMAPSCY